MRRRNGVGNKKVWCKFIVIEKISDRIYRKILIHGAYEWPTVDYKSIRVGSERYRGFLQALYKLDGWSQKGLQYKVVAAERCGYKKFIIRLQ